MEKVELESKEGFYDVYYTPDGTRLIVLEGLNPEDQFIPPPLQKTIHEHYASISLLYWLILGITLTYMVGLHIVIPLLNRYNLH